jgi:hypothetical protein
MSESSTGGSYGKAGFTRRRFIVGYYDVVITANTSDGFRRRYAGRIA